MSTPAQPPHGRYPTRDRPRRRTVLWLVAVVALVIGVTLAYLAYDRFARTPISAERVAFDEQAGNRMEVTIDVRRADPDRAGVCFVAIRDISGAETGRKEVYVPPGSGAPRLSTVVSGIERPVTADVEGCSHTVLPYLRPSE